ncbi:MAG: DUF2235 domain-containing protein [Sedimentitalea sp.]|uniref:DUF2235 domain-containing protein n=1 Tax=Sedimentitalea sp. TaxID=2048915 RepID=UPI0032647FCE
MKRIAVFCDGTWNSPTRLDWTHVVNLYNAVDQQADVQIAHYFRGVGTETSNAGFFGGLLNRIGGGAFGWGLELNIKQAYAYVCKVYEPGDEILIFGFSRGAYTARSLAGMIRKCGILDDYSSSALSEAFKLYKASGEGNRPDSPSVMAKRKQKSPRFATSEAERAQRNDGSSVVKISYIGVWDTVGSLGIPSVLLGSIASLWNKKYEFHDTDLSSMVTSARHALALDERRAFFLPSPWNNLDDSDEGPGLNRGDTSDDRPFQQLWFVGDHGIVGGTGDSASLSAITLQWIAEGAKKAGLTLRPDANIPAVDPNPADDVPVLRDPSPIYGISPDLLVWRDGPAISTDASPTVKQRLDAMNAYRPLSLKRLFPDLF